MSGQRAVVIGPGSVCSKDANGGSGRGIGDPIFAVKHVNKRRNAGGVGRRASSIARPIRARSGGANSHGGIDSDSVNGKRRQLTRMGRARASAYSLPAKIFRASRAIGRVATNFSPFPMSIRASVFAVWRADWLCVASWIGKRAWFKKPDFRVSIRTLSAAAPRDGFGRLSLANSGKNGCGRAFPASAGGLGRSATRRGSCQHARDIRYAKSGDG